MNSSSVQETYCLEDKVANNNIKSLANYCKTYKDDKYPRV